ncbi:MAG: hypothetical protein HUJ26_20445 [Planctomycetaceae bacterium]|nr:hypothetical protein [Planctomycetaceae bacterium]
MRKLEFTLLILIAVCLAVLIYPPHIIITDILICTGNGDLMYIDQKDRVSTRRLEEPYRALIIKKGGLPERTQLEWHHLGNNHGSSNHIGTMTQNHYREAAVWLSEEPRLGKLILQDVVANLRETNGRGPLPQSTSLLNYVQRNESGELILSEDWKHDEYTMEVIDNMEAMYE